MILSADELNLRSPYRLAQVNDMTFSFVTDQQIRYNVGFYKDTYFMDDGAYHFFIDNSEHEHGSYDPKILDVVTVILEEFFSQEPTGSSIPARISHFFLQKRTIFKKFSYLCTR